MYKASRWVSRFVLALSAVVLVFTSSAYAQFSSVRVQVIDVGQADGILVRTPNSKWVLIDAGQDGNLGPALSSSFGVDTLELAIGSHRHRDHIGGMDEVFYNVPVKLYVADTNNHVIRTIDLDDGNRVATLEISGLEPPEPPKIDTKPSFPGAAKIDVPVARVRPVDGKIRLQVALDLPGG